MEVIYTQLWINEKVYKSSDITVYGLAVYCSIKSLLSNDEIKQIYVNEDILSFQLTRTLNNPRRFTDSLKIGLDELIANDIVTVIEKKGKSHILDCSNLFITEENEYFTIITYSELIKIFKSETNYNFALLRYFIYLIGTISSSIDVWIDAVQHKYRVVGNLTTDYIAQLCGISERTLIRYNQILEENNLIYIYRSDDFVINESNGKLKRLVNIYGRPKDKIYIDTFAANQQKYKKSYKYVENKVKTANTKRRLAQMYIQIKRGNDKKYSRKEIQDVFCYVVEENTKYEKLCDIKNDDKYLDKVRDTDVFLKYDFLGTENDKK